MVQIEAQLAPTRRRRAPRPGRCRRRATGRPHRARPRTGGSAGRPGRAARSRICRPRNPVAGRSRCRPPGAPGRADQQEVLIPARAVGVDHLDRPGRAHRAAGRGCLRHGRSGPRRRTWPGRSRNGAPGRAAAGRDRDLGPVAAARRGGTPGRPGPGSGPRTGRRPPAGPSTAPAGPTVGRHPRPGLAARRLGRDTAARARARPVRPARRPDAIGESRGRRVDRSHPWAGSSSAPVTADGKPGPASLDRRLTA